MPGTLSIRSAHWEKIQVASWPTRRRFGLVLDTEDGQLAVAHSFGGTVIQVNARYFHFIRKWIGIHGANPWFYKVIENQCCPIGREEMRWKRNVYLINALGDRPFHLYIAEGGEGGSAAPRTMLTQVVPRLRGAISAGPVAEFLSKVMEEPNNETEFLK